MRDLLRSASDVYKTADARILLVGHCLLVSSWFRDPWRNRFLLCYWVGAQLSGSVQHRASAHRVYMSPCSMHTHGLDVPMQTCSGTCQTTAMHASFDMATCIQDQ